MDSRSEQQALTLSQPGHRDHVLVDQLLFGRSRLWHTVETVMYMVTYILMHAYFDIRREQKFNNDDDDDVNNKTLTYLIMEKEVLFLQPAKI